MNSAPQAGSGKRCFQCGAENPVQSFCGTCGSPLQLDAYINGRVSLQLGEITRDRDLVERESAIKIFEKAYNYAKLFAWVAVAIAVPFAAFGIYKWSDLMSAVNGAKQTVTATVEEVKHDSAVSLKRTRTEVADTSAQAEREIKSASDAATKEAHRATTSAAQARQDIAQQSADVHSQVEEVRNQVKSAREIQPQITDLQQRLKQAMQEIDTQRKALGSSQEFAKQIFQSYATEYFLSTQTPADRMRVPPRKQGQGATVYLLLKETPIPQTTQLQWRTAAQPRNSYVNVHNLVMFNWADPATSFSTEQLSVAYFPDKSDQQLIKSLSERDARVYADGEPLVRFGEPDPDFLKLVTPHPAPAKP